MPTPFYHYTTGDRLMRILANKHILPATSHVEAPEIPAVWLSSDPVWETSATKGVIKDGARRQASLAELISLCGCLVRIEIDPSGLQLLGPQDFKQVLRMPENVHTQLLASGLEMGADPTNWRAVAQPIPLRAFRCIECSAEAHPPHWIQWPNVRLRAS